MLNSNLHLYLKFEAVKFCFFSAACNILVLKVFQGKLNEINKRKKINALWTKDDERKEKIKKKQRKKKWMETKPNNNDNRFAFN